MHLFCGVARNFVGILEFGVGFPLILGIFLLISRLYSRFIFGCLIPETTPKYAHDLLHIV